MLPLPRGEGSGEGEGAWEIADGGTFPLGSHALEIWRLPLADVFANRRSDLFPRSSFIISLMTLHNKIPRACFIPLMGVLALASAGCTTTSQAARPNGPAVYKVAFENEKIRVLE